eukprot:TRINITY_DN6219_c0_g1_i1.p1 TRINITY_DN6219_c0_g1~~TRINITY_DN6219_c0_g1_i1.p1  ORF type:complete len:155 (-),score=36.42 TRINITY_DN6219_c0_g1_i1:71-535(-)
MVRHYKNKLGGPSTSRRKQRKAYFRAPSNVRRKIMSARLSPELKAKYGVKSMPIHKDDEVQVMRGTYKTREGKVTNVYRKKYQIYIEKISKEKANGATYNIPFNTSNVMITNLKLDKNRKKAIERKAAGRAKLKGQKGPEKFTEETVSQMSTVD